MTTTQQQIRQELLKKRLENDKTYDLVRLIAHWSDTAFSIRIFGRDIRFGLDPILGLVLPAVGDTVSLLTVLPALFVSLFRVRSLSLTSAILFNAIADLCMGAIPFFIGDLLDLRHRSNTQNYQLIVGFVEKDKAVISSVRRKAWMFALGILALGFLTYWVIRLSIWLTTSLWEIISAWF